MKFKKIVLAYDMEGALITRLYIVAMKIIPITEQEIKIVIYQTTLGIVYQEIKNGVPYFAGKQCLVLDGGVMIKTQREEGEVDELGHLPNIEEYLGNPTTTLNQ